MRILAVLCRCETHFCATEQPFGTVSCRFHSLPSGVPVSREVSPFPKFVQVSGCGCKTVGMQCVVVCWRIAAWLMCRYFSVEVGVGWGV